MEKMPLFNELNKIIDEDTISFHVPGHKKGAIFQELDYKNYKERILNIDTTEIPGTDNLHSPEGVIKTSQEIASKVFKSDYTFFLVNGSTCGIQSAVMSICNPNDKIIVSRDCHQSVINGCILGGIEPIYVNPKIDLNLGISLGVQLNDIKRLLDENEDAKGIIITSPTYFGVTSDIKKIADEVHIRGKILIVDEAHGSHLGLSDKLPKTALELGADIVIQSTHKTLSAFTQASMLHVKGDRVDLHKLKSILRILQSSSPSYILMSSLEMASYIYENEGKRLMDEVLNSIIDVKDFIKSLKNIDIFGDDGKEDITKMYILTKRLGKTGYEVEDTLREKYNIQVELSNPYGILLISSIGNRKKDFEKLKKALSEIDKQKHDKNIENLISYPIKLPNKVLSPREAFYSKKTSINIEDSIGKICGEYIIPYPPGIAILCPGEKISREIVDYAVNSKKLGMNITGIKDNTLNYIQIID